MKTISKLFVMLFGLSQYSQCVAKSPVVEKIEREAEAMAERLCECKTDTITQRVNGKAVYTNTGIGLSKSEFIKYMYNSQRVICL